jgi:hypothetical protein
MAFPPSARTGAAPISAGDAARRAFASAVRVSMMTPRPRPLNKLNRTGVRR